MDVSSRVGGSAGPVSFESVPVGRGVVAYLFVAIACVGGYAVVASNPGTDWWVLVADHALWVTPLLLLLVGGLVAYVGRPGATALGIEDGAITWRRGRREFSVRLERARVTVAPVYISRVQSVAQGAVLEIHDPSCRARLRVFGVGADAPVEASGEPRYGGVAQECDVMMLADEFARLWACVRGAERDAGEQPGSHTGGFGLEFHAGDPSGRVLPLLVCWGLVFPILIPVAMNVLVYGAHVAVGALEYVGCIVVAAALTLVVFWPWWVRRGPSTLRIDDDALRLYRRAAPGTPVVEIRPPIAVAHRFTTGGRRSLTGNRSPLGAAVAIEDHRGGRLVLKLSSHTVRWQEKPLKSRAYSVDFDLNDVAGRMVARWLERHGAPGGPFTLVDS